MQPDETHQREKRERRVGDLKLDSPPSELTVCMSSTTIAARARLICYRRVTARRRRYGLSRDINNST